MEKLKEFLGNLDSKKKKLLIAGGIALVAFAVIMGLIINRGSQKTYEVLFSEVSSDEARQITGKLQEDGVPFQQQGNDILVPVEQLDTTKAKLVSEGYPKSGFTYNVFKENVSLMTTDSERRAFMIYDLQNRIGATIEMFEGVKEAHVTLALTEPSKYALSDDAGKDSSAQAIVIMRDGGSPTEEQAKSVQRLISRSIPGMVIENVSVFDGNGLEVSVETGDKNTNSGKEGEEIARLIENQISANIKEILGGFYGSQNVRVAVKGRVNMEKLIREVTTYNVPNPVNEEDKTGILSKEAGGSEYSGDGQIASGVAGAEANADIPQYNAGDGENAQNAYGANQFDREYLVNQIKEQGQIDPGVLEDVTISVGINAENFGRLQRNDLISLIGNAAGIAAAEQAEKITVIAAPFYRETVPGESSSATGETPVGGDKSETKNLWIYIIIGAVVGLLLLVTLIIILIVRSKKKKKRRLEEANAAAMAGAGSGGGAGEAPAESVLPEITVDPEEERALELRENIRDFVEQNPEISAHLLKNWLNGGNKEDE